MKFTEERLEQVVIELFEAERYQHFTGEQINKELPEGNKTLETTT